MIKHVIEKKGLTAEESTEEELVMMAKEEKKNQT